MTKQDAIKYLQQLYPNGGHCWLDEQRIEAIDMAIKALQEEPVSEELEEAANDYDNHFGALYVEDEDGDYVENLTARKNAFKAGYNLHKEKMMKGAKSGIGDFYDYIKFEDGTWIDLDPSEQLKPAFNVNEGDKVKVIVIKED